MSNEKRIEIEQERRKSHKLSSTIALFRVFVHWEAQYFRRNVSLRYKHHTSTCFFAKSAPPSYSEQQKLLKGN